MAQGKVLFVVSLMLAVCANTRATRVLLSDLAQTSWARPRSIAEANGTAPRARAQPLSFRLQMGVSARMNSTEMRVQSERRRQGILAARRRGGPASYGARVVAGSGAFLTASTALGTPAMGWTALIDTGSDLVWRQCRPCRHCYASGSGSPMFNPRSSTTYRSLACDDPRCAEELPEYSCSSSSSCNYVYTYGDSSFSSGELASDTLSLPDGRGTPAEVDGVVFGCGHDNENGVFAGADGLIGLGRGPLSLISQLDITRFSYCLQPMADPPSRTSPLLLGPSATISTTATITTTPLLSSPSFPSFYLVSLSSITVDSLHAALPPDAFADGVIFDSGTTLTYLATPAYDPVLRLLRSSIEAEPIADSRTGLDLCYEGLPERVPELVFRFEGGADMELPVENYVVEVEDGVFCVSMAPSDDISIIGNLQQQNFHILYDVGAQRLSFARASCDSL